MKLIIAVVFSLLFITIPSLIYSVICWVFTVILAPLALIHQLLMGKERFLGGAAQRILIGSVVLKIVAPLFLIFVIPIIFFIAGWFLIACIFGGWMITYFIIRRYSGVSQAEPKILEAYKRLQELDEEVKLRKFD